MISSMHIKQFCRTSSTKLKREADTRLWADGMGQKPVHGNLYRAQAVPLVECRQEPL